MDKAKENLFKAIKIIMESMNMPFDQTKDGRVIEILDNGRYKVQIRDKTYTIKSQFHYNVNEQVSVLFKCGNEHNLYIHPNKFGVIVSETAPSLASVADGDIWVKS